LLSIKRSHHSQQVSFFFQLRRAAEHVKTRWYQSLFDFDEFLEEAHDAGVTLNGGVELRCHCSANLLTEKSMRSKRELGRGFTRIRIDSYCLEAGTARRFNWNETVQFCDHLPEHWK